MTDLYGVADPTETVLLVDDDEAMRDTLAELLRMDGIETITAGRVDEARKLVAIHTPAVVVVDYQLPDGTGIDLAQDVKAHDPEIPVLLLTGYATLDSAIRSGGPARRLSDEAGCSAAVPKERGRRPHQKAIVQAEPGPGRPLEADQRVSGDVRPVDRSAQPGPAR